MFRLTSLFFLCSFDIYVIGEGGKRGETSGSRTPTRRLERIISSSLQCATSEISEKTESSSTLAPALELSFSTLWAAAWTTAAASAPRSDLTRFTLLSAHAGSSAHVPPLPVVADATTRSRAFLLRLHVAEPVRMNDIVPQEKREL